MKRVLFVVVLSIAVVAALWLAKGEAGQSVREAHRSAEPRAAGVKKVDGAAVSRVATSQDEPEESADTAEDRSVTLHGRVVDAHAEPVDGAAVSIDSVPPRALRVSKDGAFAFEGLARRTYRLLARSSDGMAATRQLSVDAETPEVELVLEPAAALEIAVHGALDARPIAGVRVRVDEDPNVEGTTD